MGVNYKRVVADVVAVMVAVVAVLAAVENEILAAHVNVPAPEGAAIVGAIAFLTALISIGREVAGNAVASALAPKRGEHAKQ